jgi:Fe-S-cluster-containing hydrogenase component 2
MITIDLAKCSGCRSCEVACSFTHTGSVNRLTSRIRVVNLYESGVDGPVLCRQCRERYCLDCPAGAIRRGSLGQVIVSPTACTLCKRCQGSCPVGAVEIFDDIVYVCDLCGGSPRCVEACNQGAITFSPDESETVSLEPYKQETTGMNVSERRAYFVTRLGEELRKGWGGQ